jgi:tRNA pseudouridine38-40 synthase
MKNIRLTLEYDGTSYCGWQRQKNGLSIQQALEESIGRITGEKVTVTGSGRTDSGVHALSQIANFHTHSSLSLRGLLLGINSLLPEDIVIRRLEEADAEFHACFSAKSKIYLYQICNSPVRPVIERRYSWFLWEPLSVEAMKECAAVFLGRHDFSSFCSTHNDSLDRVRDVLSLKLEKDSRGMIRIFIEADGFLRHMVRTIVGALAAVGLGKTTKEEVVAMMEAKDRRRAGMTAPPQGLFLFEVRY